MVIQRHAQSLVVFPVDVFGSFALLYHGDAIGAGNNYIISNPLILPK